jgi:amino acid adenylation domain-containing protein
MDQLSERLARLSPEQLADLMRRARGGQPAGGAGASIPRRAGTGPVPLSFAQRRLWFVQQLDPANVAYNMVAATRLNGALDVDALRRVLNAVVERHEALRTVFVSADGEPAQRVVQGMRVPLEVDDLAGPGPADEEAEVGRRARAEQARPFDLEAGPLLRARLLRIAPGRHVLLMVMHHVISDGWSRGVIVREISSLYTAFSTGGEAELPPLPIQYPDYAAWQRERLQGAVLAEQLAYWTGRLANAPAALQIPTDHPRPAAQSHAGRTHRFRLPPDLAGALREIAREEGATLFMVLLAAFKVLLARYSGQADLVVGTPVANRGRAETQGLVGFFANTLALRTDLSGDPTFREALARVRDTAVGAYAHEEMPFERLVEALHTERSLDRGPLFQVMFLLDEAPLHAFDLPGLRLEPLEVDAGTSMFDLTLGLERAEDGLAGRLEYATDLFDAPAIERMAEHFGVLLRGLASAPDTRLSGLPMQTLAERGLLAAWNATDAGYPSDHCVHRLFAAQAARTPDAAALVFHGETTSYAELDVRSNRLANHLRGLGVAPEHRVGVCLERTPKMIVALLAVLKAGGAYVPLDPAYPRERLGYMVRDAGVRFVLATAQLADRLPAGAEALCIDTLRARIAAEPSVAPESGVTGENLSHVIFTSGSTGRPKGVMIRHAGTAILLHWMRDNVSGEERSSVLGSTSINFDVSVAEIFGTLCWGGTLVLVENALALPSVADQGIRYASMVPTAAAELLRSGGIPASVRTLNLGGEALPNDLAQALYALGTVERVGNLYGPTEDTTYSTYSLARRGADRVRIGRPVANTRAYVLDDRMRPAPVGIAGELYLAGGGLARGYAARPGLTAERFLPDPFGGPGSRMYRVMDRVRWTAEGELEYFGRTDFQVKVRGFRIEPGEIETALRAHAALRDAVVVVREDAPGDRRLVAYVVADEGARVPDAAELREHARVRLPEYMVPSAFVVLDALPRTPNGKLDRGALPAPDASAPRGTEYAAPRTPAEARLAAVFAEVLGVPRVGIHDDFFALGGHSLLATRVVSRVREAFGVELPLRALFEAPTVAGLAPRVDALRGAGSTDAPLVPVPREGPLPLSFAQQRLWFVQQLHPASVAYTMVGATRLEGALDVDALRRALDTVVTRHEVLRTVFAPGNEGQPVQRVIEGMRIALDVEDRSSVGPAEWEDEIERHAAAEQARAFDLEAGPLLRARLLRLSPERHALLLAMHHVVSDGWSRDVLVREVSELYAAYATGAEPKLPALPVQYADYAVWQRERMRGEMLSRHLAYWTARLADAPPTLHLPTDRPRPAAQSFAGCTHRFRLPDRVEDAFRALAREEGATLFMVLLAAFKTLLARYTAQADLVVGSPAANRGRGEVEGLIGFFANTLALRTDLSGDPTFRQALARVRETALGAYAHDELPFERLVEELPLGRDLSRNQVFQVMFVLDETPPRPFRLPGLDLVPVERDPGASMFDLLLAVENRGGGLAARLEYATDLFDAGTVQRMGEHFAELLRGIAADPDARVAALPLIPAAERDRVAAWNRTDAAYPSGHFVQTLIAAQAARTPDAIALVFRGEEISYAELDVRANRLANHLRGRGVALEHRVGVCLERTPEMIVSLLAVLKAGGAYVPLDPAYPRERLGYMVQDAGVRFVLTTAELADRLPASAEVLCIDTLRVRIAAERAEAPESGVAGENLSHVIFTSGSTGRPKGVMIRHAGTAILLHWMRENVTDEERSSVLGSTSINFDVSVAEIFGTLCWGGTLVLVENALALPSVADRGIRYASMVPTAAAELLRSGGIPASVRTLNLGGEALPNDLAQALYALGTVDRVGNLYGPTEDTTYSTYSLVRRGADRVRIGRPVANTRAHVLDDRMRPVPVGIAGELYLAGDGLARGYTARPALTAERFLPDPFGEPGSRMYRVMDRVRWTAEGELEYFGRTDFQVKVRGFRIEPGEIEAALRGHPSVHDAVVVVREDAPGDRRLVAYVVAAEGARAPDAAELRALARERLPEYMVPSALVVLAALPRTPNGKLDRGALPAPGEAGEAGEAGDPVAPRTPTEEILAGVFADVLGVERVGVHDDFFARGGHSLLAMRVVTRVREALGVELPLRAVFETPAVAGLAPRVDALRREGGRADTPLVPAPRDRPLPLSFAQQRLWFIQQIDPRSAAYNMAAAMRLDGALDADALQRAVDTVVARHEALRTVFAMESTEPVQVVLPAVRVPLALDDLSGVAAAERDGEAGRRMRAEQARPFDLQTGPLLRALLLRLWPERHVLLLVMHHVAGDGWSRGVIVREISELYAGYATGGAAELPALPVQYPDYAVWQRERLQGEVLAEQLGYWTERLKDAPAALQLLTDHPRPPVQTFAGRTHRFRLPEDAEDALRRLGREEGATLFMVLLAAFKALLVRYTAQADLVLGSPVANRGRGETEGLVGFFANMLSLRTDLSGDPTFRQALARVRETALGAYAHEELPFERLVEALHQERSLSRNQVFQVVFQMDESPLRPFDLPALRLEPVRMDPETSTFDLTFAVENREDGLAARMEYAADLFGAAGMERMAEHFCQLLRGIAADADAPLSRLPLISAAERDLVAGWNATEAGYPAACVHDLFAAQAARTPEAPALVHHGQTLSYRELDGRANRLANYLRGLGVRPETRVGVCLERTPEMIVALLGVLKAGGAYVPLDPAYPRERLGFMIHDGSVRFVLTSAPLADRLPESAEALCIDVLRERIASEPSGAPESGAHPENLSHVIFTSGSTGRPKGVMIRHSSTAILMHWMRENVSDDERSSVLASTSINFDVSVAEIFGALCWGGKLVLVENALDLPDVADQGIRFASMVPTAAAELLRAGNLPPTLRTFFSGGEALPNDLAQALHRLGTMERVANLYGPTEDTTYSTYYLSRKGEGRMLVGTPIANTRAHVLDGRLDPAPVGVMGEMYLAGDGLSRGYAARPDLTAERFVPDPFGEPGSRMYRVMDHARWTAEGELEYFGRTDFQVKVRGFRIEPGEIEAALTAHPAVHAAVVTAWDDGTGERRLAAYVVPAGGGTPDPSPSELRRWVAERMPAYMAPSWFMLLERLPLTPNGKVDRRALPDPGPSRDALEVDYAPPRNALEEMISKTWREVLGVDRVGIQDNFFDLGGTSVRLASVHRLLSGQLERPVTVVDLFRYPTVAQLAEYLDGEGERPAPREQAHDRAERQRQARAARQLHPKPRRP